MKTHSSRTDAASTEPEQAAGRRRRPPYIFSVVLVLLGLVFAAGGVRLISLGGSFYYALAGLALITSGALLWRRDRRGSFVYGLLLVATLLWSLFEVGVNLWALAPRLLALSVIGLWFLTPWVRRSLYSRKEPPPLINSRRGVSIAASVLVVSVTVLALGGLRSPVNAAPSRMTSSTPVTSPESPVASHDWPHYGNTTHGTRYSGADQITSDNAGRLEKLWHYRTGRGGAFKATPIQVGDLLYVCTGGNVIVALDADSGERRWEFDPEVKLPAMGNFATTCRGVSYHRAPREYTGDCPERILTATTDARLFAVDAKSGARCASFGANGEISLLPGMGEVKSGFYFVTSPATIARGLAIIGGWVVDNVEVNEPSGVVRAFDAMTGKFAWAWDMGRPGVNTEPAAGESYTRGTPNVWSMSSYDDELGLVYLPTGNATPDYFGAHRSAAAEKYSSSVVALDVTNGSVRWSFQTVRHDIWDYDVPSQPVLIDLPQEDGSVTPALVQGTKRGELFMLDRRTGEPITEVQERPVPQGAVPEDWTSKTQPFSVGMPNFRGPDWTEADMWGLTPLDQLWCRIEFRKLRYEGHFTPPSTQGTLQVPGNAGGFNWGSVSIDEERRLMVVNPLLMGNRLQLISRDQAPQNMRGGTQLGTPYAMTTRPFMSPLAVPCQKPPYGTIGVVDLKTRQVLWNQPIGTANESGPLGMKIGLPLSMGVPQTAGTIVTKGGVIFAGGTMDRHFRAFDLHTGKELWRDYLPGTAQATPMSYVAPRSNRQIVVLTVPNVSRGFGMPRPAEPIEEDPEGGHIIAYALPE
ncbi:MAG: membrane-bound PQQ-dependent dehydrogenase, glucose/quinate/shikimate family [Steroidobacter sp.]